MKVRRLCVVCGHHAGTPGVQPGQIPILVHDLRTSDRAKEFRTELVECVACDGEGVVYVRGATGV